MTELSREGRFIAWSMAAAVVLIVATALLTPAAVERDERPTSYNTGKKGLKAAFLTLARLGYQTERWQRPAGELGQIDAANATLIVAGPREDLIGGEAAGILDFARRGGWVLATERTAAVALLPGGKDISIRTEACASRPEGLTPMAHVSNLNFQQTLVWKQISNEVEFAQSCGDRAGGVIFPVGKGAVVVWAESTPMTNDGLKNNANLELLLASLPAAHHRVLFDEYLHDYRDTLWQHASQMPLAALRWQLALVAVAVVFSFSRRHGPLRALATAPRTSPLEFARSMGSVYHRAGAGEAAVEQARRNLFDFLERSCGLSRELLDGTPSTVCQALSERFNYTNPALEALLEPVDGRLQPAKAFQRVKALHGVRNQIAQIINRYQSQNQDSATEKQHRV